MAIYHLSVQVISRGQGRSVVAAAAYRAGERLHDERTGRDHDYSHRRDVEAEILAPEGAPEWVYDRQELWNRVEAAERRVDARLARELNVALPRELDREQARELVRAYVREHFVDRGMVADVSYHWDRDNPHCHILLTTRELTPDGFGPKVREWDRREMVQEWRAGWAEHANRALERAGLEVRIDHRSLREQGIDREPGIHLGPAAHAMQERGLQSDRASILRDIEAYNRADHEIRSLREQMRQWERPFQERAQERLAAGWQPRNVEVVAHAERLLGQPIPLGQEIAHLSRAQAERQQRLHQLETWRHEVARQEQRMAAIDHILAQAERAQQTVDRLSGPVGWVVRLFSAEARQEYQAARLTLEATPGHLRFYGIERPEDIQRLENWLSQVRQHVPSVEREMEQLRYEMGVLGQAEAAAWNEWQRSFERQQQREMERQHGLERHYDQGRTRQPERDHGLDLGW